MMIHDPRSQEDMDIILGKGGALEALRALQDEGLVGSLGVATGTVTPLKLAVECDEFDVIQFPRLFTILNHAAMTSGLLDAARAKNIGTLAAAPFAGNVLATGVRGVERPLYGYWEAQPEVVEAVGKMQDRAEELGVTLAKAALQYAVMEPKIHSVVVGITKPSELEQNVAALTPEIPRADLDSIAAAGPVDEHFIGGPEFVWPFPDERMPEGPAREAAREPALSAARGGRRGLRLRTPTVVPRRIGRAADEACAVIAAVQGCATASRASALARLRAAALEGSSIGTMLVDVWCVARLPRSGAISFTISRNRRSPRRTERVVDLHEDRTCVRPRPCFRSNSLGRSGSSWRMTIQSLINDSRARNASAG